MTAQLAPIDITTPASKGLWTEKRGTILPIDFATVATNLRINDNGALTVRQGYTDVTSTELSSLNIESLHEFHQADESTELILAWDGGISNDIDDPAGGDISGSVTDANGTWFFQDFNDKCIGFQEGQKLIVYTGTGNFATVVESGGTAPSGGVGCAAYGRIWQVDSSGSVIQYCGLLDETDWNGSGAGSIDMNSIWTNGQDTITAIRAFNSALVVWGKKHVVFFADASGSSIGLNPTNIYVQDVIAGTGCVDQHTVQLIGEEDIVWLSKAGVQSLGRLIQEKGNPIETLSEFVKTELNEVTRAATAGTIHSLYNEDDQLYWVSFPDSAVSYVFDLGRKFATEQGETRAPAFRWTLAPFSMVYRLDGNLNIGMTNKVGLISGFQDDGANIDWNFETGWLDFGEEFANRLKILKRLSAYLSTAWSGSFNFKWYTDFKSSSDGSRSVSVAGTEGDAQWGISEWNEGEFGGSVTLDKFRTGARAKGQYFKIGLSASVDKTLTLLQVEILSKLGRLA